MGSWGGGGGSGEGRMWGERGKGMRRGGRGGVLGGVLQFRILKLRRKRRFLRSGFFRRCGWWDWLVVGWISEFVCRDHEPVKWRLGW